MKWCVLTLALVHLSLAQYQIQYSEWPIDEPSQQVVVNIRNRYPNAPAIYHDFINDTLERMPQGVCHREVP